MGPKSSVLKEPKMNTFSEWKPTNSQGGNSVRLKEVLEGAWQQIRRAIDLFLAGSPSAKGVMQEMLAEYKIHTSAIFITEITLYYDEILSKTGGGGVAHSKEVKESWWALVTKLLRTILKEVHKARRFAAAAVSIGTDVLVRRVGRDSGFEGVASCNWRDHPKFNQNIVRHLFETCLPRTVYENRKECASGHSLKINAITATTECHQALLNGIATSMRELRAKVGLLPAEQAKFEKGTAGEGDAQIIE
jgi:hypothetical protein